MNRFVGQSSAFHAGAGAERRAACDHGAPTHVSSSLTRVWQLVTVDLMAPKGGAQAP